MTPEKHRGKYRCEICDGNGRTGESQPTRCTVCNGNGNTNIKFADFLLMRENLKKNPPANGNSATNEPAGQVQTEADTPSNGSILQLPPVTIPLG